MKYNVLQHVPGFRGELLQEQGKDAQGKPTLQPATYASLLSMLVNVPEQDPKKARGLVQILDAVDEAAYKRGAISSGQLELEAEQVAYIKDNALKCGMSPTAYGRLVTFLESPSTDGANDSPAEQPSAGGSA